ncbi:MAG: hypothetical protein AB1295_05640 [Candidatus Micrarchaeota archaeon]
MKLRNIIIGTIGILLITLMAIVVVVLASDMGEEGSAPPVSSFSVLESGTAGDFAYNVYRFRGSGNLTVYSYPSEPKHAVVIINDSQAIQASRLQELIERIKPLERYGIAVTVTQEPKIGDDIYVIPTGGIPSYALFNLQQGSSTGTIIYIGEKDLLLSSGIKKLDWYNQLKPEQRARVVLYPGTLDDFLESGNVSLEEEILRSSWMAQNSSFYMVSGEGESTVSVPLNGSGYTRIIYEMEGLNGVFDSSYLQTGGMPLEPEPGSIYPWEKSMLEFSLGKTNGTAFLSVKKDGKTIEHEQLRRVLDENVFLKRFEYQDAGDYILTVDDNTGQIASGLLHVKDLQITLLEKVGSTYVFSVMEDGRPMGNSEAYVSLGDSAPQRFFISDGKVAVAARPPRGLATFDFRIGQSEIPVTIDNPEDPLIDFYLKYGLPAIGLVALAFFGARITRRPTYRLRFGDSAEYLRQEMALPVERAMESFRAIRDDMKLGSSPVTPHEFGVSLKRYLTNGADVTEGNVEEILKKLVKHGRLEYHRDYYQQKGEGDVIRNVLRRMVREKLIENGVLFKEKGGKFETKDFEIGFFGDKFDKKGIVVVDDKTEENRIIASMGEAERARVRLLQANDMLVIVPIDRLSDVL